MKQNKKIVGHIALLFVNIFFGINLSVSKELLDGTLTPLGMNVLRFLFGAVVFWTLSVMKPEKVSNKDLLMLFLGALLGLLGNQIFFIQGLSRTSTIDASIIATTVPIITMILSAMVLKEPLTWVKALGVFTGASGAVYLVLSANGSADFSGNMTGDLLCFMSALSFSAFLVLTKNVTKRYSSVTVMKWMFLFASVLALPFSGSDLAAEQIKVVLSGEGADEFFGGYNIYHEPISLKGYQKIPKCVRKGLAAVAKKMPDIKGRDFIIRGSKTVEERFIGNANMFSVEDREKLLKTKLTHKTPQDIVADAYKKVSHLNDIAKMQYIDTNFWLQGDILLKADKMSMAQELI
jgi:drug/metabolite transporter (DMT)-like permease